MELNNLTFEKQKIRENKGSSSFDKTLKNGSKNTEFVVGKRSHDFIDQSLLEQEYIRDSNNFIIELIDEQHIDFPKSAETTNNCGNSLNTDFNFSNSIFHFINKSSDEAETSHLPTFAESSSSLDLSNSRHSNTFHSKSAQNFITINENFINSNTLVENNNNEMVVENVPQFPTLSLLSDNQEIEEDAIHRDELMCPPSNARKILPHKKRISSKLKIAQTNCDMSFAASKVQKSPFTSAHMQFSCEICSFATSSQIDFFSHLKEHYEPSTSVLTSMKFTLNSLNSQRNNISEIKKVQIKNSLFSETSLQFVDFSEVKTEESPPIQSNKESEKNLEKEVCNYETKENYELKVINANDVEFSDPEDMLEDDFRNVVARVSIEETSDNINLIDKSNSRSPWFTGNFCGIDFKNKSFDDETLSGHLENILDVGNVSIVDEPPIDKQKINKSSESLNLENLSNNTATKLKSKKLYTCTKCNRKFNSSNALKYHSRTHTGIRPHECKICGKSFFAEGALKSHVYIHTGDKPFDCDKCDRKFRQWGDLKFHIISKHTNEKSHQCEFCGKAFSRKYSLVIHRRIHTYERNYKCEYCDKTFRASSYLQNHRKIHTGEKPYECDICHKKFRVCGDMRRHKKIHQRLDKSTND